MTNHPQAGVIAYNAGDQMKSVTRNGVTNDYVYAGTGHTELLAHEVPGKGTYKYTYGRNNAIGQPVIEQVTVGTATAYLENDASGTPIMLRSSAGMHALYIYDNLGSPAALITTANSTAFTYKFDPYGAPELTEDSGGLGTRQTPFIFTGGLNDRTTGWVLNGARYYDPSESRWTQHDTLDAPREPQDSSDGTWELRLLERRAGDSDSSLLLLARAPAISLAIVYRRKFRRRSVSESREQALFFGIMSVVLGVGAYWSIVYNPEGSEGGRWPFSGTALGVFTGTLAIICLALTLHLLRKRQ